MTIRDFTRRRVLRHTALLPLAAALPRVAVAQSPPLRLGVLTPLTGAGGFDGPRMLKAMQAVADELNGAGGLLNRHIELVVEDDQTNPDDAVRAAHKLIDVERVPVIMGTWASAVTTAVLPLCWESKTFLCTVSGADSITQMPHQGYLIRTQPNNKLQATKHAEFILALGIKHVFLMSIQAPFTEPTRNYLDASLRAAGGGLTGHVIYEKDKTSYRAEVDQALRTKPELIYLNGYAPDVAVLLRELYRAGYDAPRFTQSYALTSKSLEQLPAEVTEGCYTAQPSADVASPAYARALARLHATDADSYESQATDWISLVSLAIAKAGEATGTAIRDNVKKVTQKGAPVVYTAIDGLKPIAEGKNVKYEGASGPCEFNEIGDITDCRFRFMKVEGGKLKFLKVA
jgi:ABC-type branched-subunit amino acid transport system substrate-binding protein